VCKPAFRHPRIHQGIQNHWVGVLEKIGLNWLAGVNAGPPSRIPKLVGADLIPVNNDNSVAKTVANIMLNIVK
jgi:hypothetical protein